MTLYNFLFLLIFREFFYMYIIYLDHVHPIAFSFSLSLWPNPSLPMSPPFLFHDFVCAISLNLIRVDWLVV